MDRSSTEVEAIVSKVVEKIASLQRGDPKIGARIRVPIEASARHVHLNQAALEKLFGPGAALKKARDLSQPGEFLAEQRVKVVTPKGELANVAVLGPLRDAVQVELSQTDCRSLGVKAPVNVSGDLRGASDAYLVGPCGAVEAKGSVIVARAHAHLRPQDAQAHGLRDGQIVAVEVTTPNVPRQVAFGGVVIRVRETFAPAVHIDFDEANACLLGPESTACIVCDGEAVMENGSACKAARPNIATPHGECCSCDEKVLTEKMAKEIVAACDCRRVLIGAATVVTPAARDIFSAAKWAVERRS